MGDLVLRAEARPLPTRKIGPVVGDDGMGKSEATNEVLPEEFANLLPCDIEERYCFYPFYEVVCGDK